MIKSMTGYGRARTETEDGVSITVEIRSVNHRYLDITVKAPRVYGYLEEPVKSIASKEISRGKVEIYLSIDVAHSNFNKIYFNRPVLDSYMDVFSQIKADYNIDDTLSAADIARLPDVLTCEREEIDAEKLTAAVTELLSKAMADFSAMRETEGERLRADVTGRLDSISEMVRTVEARAPERVAEYRERIETRMHELLNGAGIDQQRILAEAAIFADKTAVDEEIVRLDSHISQMHKMLSGSNAIGRKLDFIVQEMNREANTIGSKCNDYDMAETVIGIKAEIEKIREQIQNIE